VQLAVMELAWHAKKTLPSFKISVLVMLGPSKTILFAVFALRVVPNAISQVALSVTILTHK
jgi:hypothetical protein